VACTGVAGPDPQGGREVGTVFVARWCAPGAARGRSGAPAVADSVVSELRLPGPRAAVREATVLAVLDLLDAMGNSDALGVVGTDEVTGDPGS